MPSNDKQIIKLMGEIHDGSIQLPEFQRGWVWDDGRIQALISSVVHQYPIGAVTFLRYGNADVKFQYRPIEGSPERNKGVVPKNLILDGQQRLTSLYCVLYSEKPVHTKTEKKKDVNRYYYIDIEKALDPDADDKDIIFSVSADKKEVSKPNQKEPIDISRPEAEYENKLFPLNLILHSTETSRWQISYHTYYQSRGDDAEYKKAVDIFDRFQISIVDKVRGYEMPVIFLEDNTPREAVCRIFENINKNAVMLNVFELVTATFAMRRFDLRKDWEERSKTHFRADILLEDNKAFTRTDFLTALTLFASWKKRSKAISCKRRDVLELSLDDYTAYATLLVNGFKAAEKLLHEECIYSANNLPYSTQLIPMAAICAALDKKIRTSVVKEKIKQWYWCGVFGELYGSANESRFAQDMTQVVNWANGDAELPKTCQEATFNPMRLLSMINRSSAAYKGVMALIMKNGSMDFISGSCMNLSSVYVDENIDIHHIFPKKYCSKSSVHEKKCQSIVNKTPLSSSTNRIIGGIAPSKYLRKIVNEKKVRETDLNHFLESHWIVSDFLWNDDFNQFFIHRAKKLLDAIEKATGKEIAGRDSQEVVQSFGDKLL